MTARALYWQAISGFFVGFSCRSRVAIGQLDSPAVKMAAVPGLAGVGHSIQ